MTPADFIATARDLAQANNRGRPRQTNLRRAVSTTYYALFHAIAGCCADTLVGGPSSNRSEGVWLHVYRLLEHGYARRRCADGDIEKFPVEIQHFAYQFVQMQRERHRADYNPAGRFYKDWVLQMVAEAEYQLDSFANVPIRDRRAFAVVKGGRKMYHRGG